MAFLSRSRLPCKRVITCGPREAAVHGHRFADAPSDRASGGARPRPAGRGARRGRPPVERAEVAGWFAGRLPDDWFTGPVELTIDRDEITVVGTLPEPDAGRGRRRPPPGPGGSRGSARTPAEQRMAIADAAQERYGRSVAWGAACGDTRELFTNLSMPVMTRLRQAERLVLDTLVDAGVARSRSEALAWAVRLVGQHAEEWLTELRDAMESVEEVRGRGPQAGADSARLRGWPSRSSCCAPPTATSPACSSLADGEEAWEPTGCAGWSRRRPRLPPARRTPAGRWSRSTPRPTGPADTDAVDYWRAWRPPEPGDEEELWSTRIAASVHGGLAGHRRALRRDVRGGRWWRPAGCDRTTWSAPRAGC